MIASLLMLAALAGPQPRPPEGVIALMVRQVETVQVQPPKKDAPPADGPVVSMPAEITVAVGRLAALTIISNGSVTKWIIPKELDVFREYDPGPTTIRLRLIGYQAGQFPIYAYTALNDQPSDPAVCVVTVGTPGPPPPPPPPPPPSDPLFKSLKAAWQQDGADATKAAALAGLYRQASLAFDNPAIKTCGDLVRALHMSAESLVPGGLPATRRVLADDLNGRLKVQPIDPLTPAITQVCLTQFSRYATLLEALK